MLRLVSIIGIALAMVVGFVALSTQMKDDYTARTAVVKVISELKTIAGTKLQCAKVVKVPPSVVADAVKEPTGQSMPVEPGAVESLDEGEDISGDSVEDSAPDADVEKLPENLSKLKLAMNDDGTLSITGFFQDIKGESGKLKVRAGSIIELQCRCEEQSSLCSVVNSNISKNYIPKKIDG